MEKHSPMKGRRVYPREDGNLYLAEGDYGFNLKTECWQVRPPGCHAGSIPHHTITEHDDKTITVSPSIMLVDGKKSWHGWLQRGVWRKV